VSRRDFWRILYGLREEGVTILIATAYLDEAERCHRLALLHGGRLMHCDTPAALKARLPGALLSILTPEPRAVRAAVTHLPGVTSAVLVGDGVHVLVDDAARRIPELEQALSSAAIAHEPVVQVAPSIEDLFAALLDTAPGAAS
jgi:ABC-2 type transport system ATP-binding protein